MQALKLLVLGPVGSGKSTISNFLADATEISYEYHPTRGVRILEFEVKDISVKKKLVKADVELWDCSGDPKYKSCWPALKKDVQGVIFIHSSKTQDKSRELEQFYEYFVNQTKLGPKNCLLLYNDPEKNSVMPKKLSLNFAKMSHISCDLEGDGNKLKVDFQAYLSTLLTKLQETTDQEEINIVNSILT